MTLYEAFILTAHTGYIADQSFIDNGQASQLFIDMCAKLLDREVYKEEFIIDQSDILVDLKKASYDEWMKILKSEKE